MPRASTPVLQSIANVFHIPDLRNRILFTLGLLAVYRLGAFILVPGINHEALEQLFQAQSGNLFGLMDLFAGGNLRRFSVFALGIMPYITASIVLQLLTVVIPRLQALAKEGEAGRKKITEYTRYGTVLISGFQSFWTAVGIEKMGDAAFFDST